MPIIQDFQCDVIQEMNWVKDRNPIVGYVNSLTIAGTPLAVNLTNLWDPIAQENSLDVAGVMDYCAWPGGTTQPIRMSFLVDNANQVTILNLLDGGLVDSVLQVEFTVYNFDQQASPNVYYPTFWTDGAAMTGVIAKEGTVLALNVERERDGRIVSPFLYRCDLAIAPTPGSQQPLFMANSSTAKYYSWFGIKYSGE
ncbi:hypothetical protein [Flavobacterium sp.]|jgi:hypothetical protein|uniref:hypothetical protein n=1 Tax=Flavobacterium sp. TaxID=239 RepID=UPI0037C1095C